MPKKLNTSLALFEPTPMLAVDPPGLRPYQQKLVTRLRLHTLDGKTRILVVGPCSMGKMVVIGSIIRTSQLPCIFVAHRMELIEQCVSTLARFGVSNISVVRGDDERFNTSASTQICSIDTLARREKPFTGQKVLILIDEAHLAAAEKYKAHIFRAYPGAIIIGFTATPNRLDGKPLGGELFEVMEVATSYAELLNNPAWLTEPLIFGSKRRIELATVKVAGGDYDDNELAKILNAQPLIQGAVEQWLSMAHRHPVLNKDGQRLHQQWENGPRRRSIGFAVNVAHSLALATAFEKAGARAGHVDGTTAESERRRLLKALEAGDIDILWNVNVLLEGFDCPPCKCVVHCRPTKSLVLWRQSTQRCMRPWQGLVPLILDHGSNMEEHGAPHDDMVWSLTDRPKRAAGTPPMKRCPHCQSFVVMGRYTCGACGFEFPAAEMRATPVVESGGDGLSKYASDPDGMKIEFYSKCVSLARVHGYKPGMASVKYKERYGTWPPREWSDQTQAQFQADGVWQGAMAAREEKKAARELVTLKETAAFNGGRKQGPISPGAPMPVDGMQEARRTDGMQGTTDTEIGLQVDGREREELFSDWLETQGIT